MLKSVRRWLCEHRLYDISSDYRVVMMLHQWYHEVEQEEVPLSKWLPEIVKPLGVPEFIGFFSMKALMEYTYYDMAHYFYLSHGNGRVPEWVTENRMRHYHKAMEEQVKLLKWKTRKFRIHTNKVEATTLLDIGCGLMPFKQLFIKANAGACINYVGIDKCDLPDVLNEKISDENIGTLLDLYKPETVFFGNSLHCFSCSPYLLSIILEQSEIQDIIIVDYRPNSMVGRTLSFHLKSHTSDWSNPSNQLFTNMAKNHHRKVHFSYPSSQHQMIHFGPVAG